MEFCELCGIDGHNYSEIKQEIKRLADCSFWLESEGKSTLHGWIARNPPPVIAKGSGVITLCLSESLRDYLLCLREQFTCYSLEWILSFKSKYSIRLYEFICSKHYHSDESYTFEITLEDLKKVMGAERYSKYTDFRIKALDPAVTDINRHSDRRIIYLALKDGHSVASFRLSISSVFALTPESQKILDDFHKSHPQFRI